MQCGVNLCCTYKIFHRNTINTVCAVTHGAAVITDMQVGVVVLLVCYLRDDIDEGDGLVIIFEAVCIIDCFFI